MLKIYQQLRKRFLTVIYRFIAKMLNDVFTEIHIRFLAFNEYMHLYSTNEKIRFYTTNCYYFNLSKFH